MVEEATLIGFLPHWESRARGAPGFDDLGVRSRVGTNPFQQVEDQSVYWVRHGNLLTLGAEASL
jgi:hypothetical protein